MEPPLSLQALLSQLTTKEVQALIAYEEEILRKPALASVLPRKAD